MITLFQASLARIQFEARDITRGADAHREGYHRADVDANICDNLYLFNSEGYTNIDEAGYLTILILSLVIIVLAIPLDEKTLWFEMLWASIFEDEGLFIKIGRFLTKPFGNEGVVLQWTKNNEGFLEEWGFWRRP
jgi:hypothetical protein